MKRIIVSLVATLTTSFAFSQEPTTVQKENLKGNVFSVMTSKYDYSENFGNPTEGKLRKKDITLFDQYGRAFLYNFDDNSFGDCFGIVIYKVDGENTVAEVSMLNLQKSLEDVGTINELLNNQVLKELDRKKREFVYNSGIMVRLDILERSYPTSKYELTYRKAAKLIGDGTYECKLYRKNGQSYLDFTETYNTNRQLIELDNERQFNRVSSYDKAIAISDAGKYQYNNKGQLVSYTQQKNSDPDKKEYIYNDHGDLTQSNTLVFHRGRKEYVKNRGLIYDNYKYDNNGNWIYRMVSNGKENLYIEKRQIEYCNTSEEIESKAKELYSIFPVIDMKAAEEFSDFYKKYLDGPGYTGQIPLIEYDSKYASVKNADKATVVVTVYFSDPNCDGKQYLRLTMPDKYYSKLKNVVDEIQKQEKECKYVYKDGKLIMNNEEYVIDTSTGEMKNITRNFTLRKE